MNEISWKETNQIFPVDNVNLPHGKMLEPQGKEFGVNRRPNCFVRSVHVVLGVQNHVLEFGSKIVGFRLVSSYYHLQQ